TARYLKWCGVGDVVEIETDFPESRHRIVELITRTVDVYAINRRAEVVVAYPLSADDRKLGLNRIVVCFELKTVPAPLEASIATGASSARGLGPSATVGGISGICTARGENQYEKKNSEPFRYAHLPSPWAPQFRRDPVLP